MSNNLIKPITLQIKKELWENFKKSIPRTMTLNNALIKLIEREIKQKR